MQHRMTAILGSLLLILASLATVTAQDATPAVRGLAGLGLPELRIIAHADRFEVPEQIPAGRTLIVYENASGEGRHGRLFRLPDGIDRAQAEADLAAATETFPGWFFDSWFPGFVGEMEVDATARVVVDLVPGIYGIADDYAAFFEVVDGPATPMAQAAPEAAVSVSLVDMGYAIPDTLPSGPQVWQVTNTGAVPHEMLFARSSEPITLDQVLEIVATGDASATPVGGGPSVSDFIPGGGVSWLSPGATAWIEVDLEPGMTYLALCWVIDPESGVPHLAMGMLDVFTAAE
jgi:hypothetical protein